MPFQDNVDTLRETQRRGHKPPHLRRSREEELPDLGGLPVKGPLGGSQRLRVGRHGPRRKRLRASGISVLRPRGEGDAHCPPLARALSKDTGFSKHLLCARHWATRCAHTKNEPVAPAPGLYPVGRADRGREQTEDYRAVAPRPPGFGGSPGGLRGLGHSHTHSYDLGQRWTQSVTGTQQRCPGWSLE